MTNQSERRTPRPALYSNIPILWDILSQVVQDWKREADPIQNQISNSDDKGQLWHLSQAFISLQTCYLKCLFSYAFFFIALENTYDLFYADLNALNHISGLNIKHEKPPKKNSYIDKVRRIRNISIAHIGSKDTLPVDSLAAMMWQPLGLNKSNSDSWDINKLTFGGRTLNFRDALGNVIAQSSDLEIGGILELNEECTQYSDEYDRVCATYLEGIINKLPVITGSTQYVAFK